MPVVLVKYKKWINTHPLLNEVSIEKSKVIEVDNLLDINRKFDNIIDIKILVE